MAIPHLSQVSISTPAGTPPLVVTSSDLVSNLNVQYLNGQLGGYYAAASSLASYLPLAGGTLTGAITVNGVSDAVVVQTNGNAAQWYGRISVRNSTSDKSSFLGTYQGVAGVFAHNNALNAWADLYVNTVDGTNGGIVRMSADVRIGGNAALHAATTSAPSLSIGGSSARWATGRTISLTGDVTGTSVAFDGTAALSFAATLAASGATAGTYNNVTVNAKGLVTGGSNASYLTSNQSISITGDATGSGSTGIVLTLANVLATPGTYTKVTANAKGLITAGTSLTSADLPTYTGTITSGQVTTGLGFTPYNASNPSSYQYHRGDITSLSSSATNVVQPLGTFDGANITNAPTSGWYNYLSSTHGSYLTSLIANLHRTADWYVGYKEGPGGSPTNPTWYKLLHSGNFNSYALPLAGGTLTGALNGTTAAFSGAITQGGNQVLHAANFSSYALPYTGGTLSGALNGTTASFSGNVKGGRVTLRDDCLEQHVDDSDGVGIFVNYFGYNSGTTRFRNFGVFNGKNQQLLYITGSTGATAITGTLAVSSAITQGGNQVLHAGNVATYALPIGGGTLTGGLSGTTASFSTKVLSSRFHDSGDAFLFRSGSGSGTTRHINLADTNSDPSNSDGGTGITWGERSDTNPYYLIYPRRYDNGYSLNSRLTIAWYTGIDIGANSAHGGTRFFNSSPFAGTEIFSVGKGDSNVRVVNTLYIGGNTALHAGNYTSYPDATKLPLTGGTLSGALNGTTAAFSGAITQGGNQVLHAGNVATYAFAKSGAWAADLVSSYGYTRETGMQMSGGSEFVVLSKSGQGYLLVDGSYIAAEAGGFYSTNNSSGGTLLGFTADTTTSLNFNTTAVKLNGNQVLHAGNYNSYALPLTGGTLTGTITATNFIGPINGNSYNNLSNNYKDIYVYGDVNTYYVVLILGEALYSFGRYSVTRGYNWTGPDTWHTASHKGGLTLDWEWSGDTAWGGNDKAIRIIEFNESYSSTVAGLGYPVNGGVIIWLRGGGVNGALYRIRTPIGSNSTVTIYDNLSIAGHVASTTFTAANSAVFSSRADVSNVSAEILVRYPVRATSGLYVDNNAVLTSATTSAPSLSIGGSAGAVPWSGITSKPTTLAGFGITDAASINGASNQNFSTNSLYIYDWIRFMANTGIYWQSGTYTGWHIYPQALWGMSFRSASTDCGLQLRRSNDVGIGSLYSDGTSIGFLDASNGWGASFTLAGAMNRGSVPGSLVTGNISGSAGAVAWSGITSKPTTLAGFGITDALPLAGGTLTGQVQISAGHGNTRFQLAEIYDNNTNHAQASFLTLWASEPGISWQHAGIGANINIGGQYYGRAGSGNTYGVYLRFDVAAGESIFYNTTGTPGVTGGQGTLRAKIAVDGEIYATASQHKVLHAGNYNSYALPLTGGALTGTVSISTTSSGAGNRTVVIKNSGQSIYDFGHYAGAWRSALQIQSNSSDRLLFFAPPEAGYEYGIIRSANGGLNIDVGGTVATTGTTGIRIEASGAVSMPGTLNVVGAVTQNGNQVLNAGNYTSYPDATKLPLAGGTLTGALNGTSASFSSVVDATQFRDSNDVAYFLDPAGTSNLNQWTTLTAARLGRSRYWTNRLVHTGDSNYHTGTNGWDTSQGTWANAWKGGFSGWDIWGASSDHPQGAGYIHAQGIVSGLHTSATDGSSAHGWMMVGAHGATDNRYWLRGKWGASISGWVEMLTTGNASYAYNMNQNVGTGNSPSFTGLSVINTITGSITGNAGTATSLANFTNQSGARYTTDFNSIVTTGFFNAEATPTNSPGGSYGQLISVKGIDTGLQIYGGYVNDNLWFRGWHTSGGTFTGWRKLLHDGNYGGYSTFTGTVTATNFSGPGTSLTGTASSLVAGSANAIADGVVSTSAKIAASVVTYAKIQNVTAYTVLGNSSASGAQAPVEISMATLAGMVGSQYTTNIGNTYPDRVFMSTDANIKYAPIGTAKAHLGITSKYGNSRPSITGDTSYWTGAMGWGATDWNTVFDWGSGFTDSWSSPANNPGDTSHHLGIQSVHYTNGSARYGWQMVNGVATGRWWLRDIWGGGFSSWKEVIHSGNIASQTVAVAGSCTGSAGSVAWTNVSGRPTAVSSFSNDSGYITSGGSISGSAGSVAWTNVSGRPTAVSSFSNDSGYITSGGSISGSSGSCSGNAASVTDGVYLSTNQYISGVKTFSSAPVATNIAKAWVHYNMNNNTINASYNVSSVTDNGTGVCTVNFSSSMVDANYVVAGTATYGYDDQDIHAMILAVPRRSTAQQAGSCRLATEYIHAAGVYDSVAVRAVFYR